MMEPEILERRRAVPFLVYSVWMELRLQKNLVDTDRQSKAIQTALKLHPAVASKLLKDMLHDGFLLLKPAGRNAQIYDIPEFGTEKNVSSLFVQS